MFDYNITHYLSNFHISILLMNVVGSFYFIVTRAIKWSSLGEASIMERQGTLLLLFCVALSTIHIIEVENGSNLIGWAIIIATELAMGAFFGLLLDKWFKLA